MKTLKKGCGIILFLLGLINATNAQKQGQALVDSLVRVLPTTKNDTLKARTYKRISEEYFFINSDKALYYSQLGLKHAQKMPWKRGIGVFTGAIGRAYSDKGMYDSCQLYFQRALAVYREIDDKWNMTSILNNLGAAEQNIASNYPKAIDYYLKALKISEELGDAYLKTVALGNVSTTFLAQKNYEKALAYALKGLQEAKKQTKESEGEAQREVGQSMMKVIAVYIAKEDYTNAKKYLFQAISLFEKTGNLEGLANAYGNLGIISGKDVDSKIRYNLKAFEAWSKVNPMQSDAIQNVGNLGEAYIEKAKSHPSQQKELLQQAEKYLQIAINRSKQKGEVSNQSYWTGTLAELQAERGDYKNAYLNFREFQSGQDSIFSQENKNKIAEVEGKREIELRDKQLEINRLELESQKKQRVGFVIGLVLLGVIGALLYWQNQTRKRTNTTLLHLNNELDEANKVKAKFFAILSHDLRSPVSNLISFLNLQKEAPELLSPELAAAHQQRITTAAEGLLDTMESMLLWSKSQMENFRPQVKEVAVNELFEYLQKFFSGNTGVVFQFENPNHLNVVTDEDYLKVIMQNLTGNALKALKNVPNGNIRWEARQEKGQVILAITDNAGGVSEQQLGALYSETAYLGGKSGLGLHLIRDLAKAISCKITVNPTPNVGTEFCLAFG